VFESLYPKERNVFIIGKLSLKFIYSALILSLMMSVISCSSKNAAKKPEGSSSGANESLTDPETGADGQPEDDGTSEPHSAESSDTGGNTDQSQDATTSKGESKDLNNGTASGPNNPQTSSRPSSVSSKNSSQGGTSSTPSFPPYTGAVMNVRNAGDPHTLGVWWWSIKDINSPTGDMYLDFLAKNRVSEIYLCVDSMGTAVSTAVVREFVKKAKKNGMRVAALAGDVNWITAGNKGFESFAVKFNNYQTSAAEDEKFYAMHLDVEPHQRSDFGSNRAAILQLLADLLTKKARPAADSAGTLLEWDIPFWFTDKDTVNDENGASFRMDELFAKKCDTVAVMSYRDTAAAMHKESKDEIAFAKKYGTKIILGAETKSSEGDMVSYMEEGKNYMNSEMLKLKNTLDTGIPTKKYGMAIHQHKTWYELKN